MESSIYVKSHTLTKFRFPFGRDRSSLGFAAWGRSEWSPVAVATSGGADLQRPLATVVIGWTL